MYAGLCPTEIKCDAACATRDANDDILHWCVCPVNSVMMLNKVTVKLC